MGELLFWRARYTIISRPFAARLLRVYYHFYILGSRDHKGEKS